MQPSPRPIVVLNAHYTGLGIARSLHGLPVTVFGLTAETDTPARSSRDLRLVRSPDTEADPEGAARFLERFAADLQARPLLVPTRDHDVHFVMHHRARLEAAYDLPMAPNAVLERVLNKQALFEVARSVGIHCPVSVEVADDAQLEAALAAVAMPVVVKPLFSRDWRRPEVRRVVRKNKAFVLPDRGRSARALRRAARARPAPAGAGVRGRRRRPARGVRLVRGSRRCPAGPLHRAQGAAASARLRQRRGDPGRAHAGGPDGIEPGAAARARVPGYVGTRIQAREPAPAGWP